MSKKVILNFQSIEGVNAGLKYFLGAKYKLLIDLLDREVETRNRRMKTRLYEDKLDIDNFIDFNDIEWNKVHLEDLYLNIFHYSTRRDAESVDSIYNLTYLLSNKNSFKDFFDRHNIRFDLNNYLLFIDDYKYDLSTDDLVQNLQNVKQKIYGDCEVWGFLRIQNINSYNSQLLNFPEFVLSFSRLLKNGEEFLADWKATFGTPCIIEFTYPLGKTEIFTNHITSKRQCLKGRWFNESSIQNNDENYQCDLKIKIGLCNLLIELYISHLTKSGYNELMLALLKGENVSSDQIVKVWSCHDFEKQSDYELSNT